MTQAHANPLLKQAMDHVFSQGLDDRMIKSLPDFWRIYYQAGAAKSNFKPADPSVLRQNAVDQKARLLTNFEPPSNDFAQAAGVAGVAQYHVVVGADGKPGEIAVGRPIGFGLDENAVASIRNASFQPAIKDGKPVPVVARPAGSVPHILQTNRGDRECRVARLLTLAEPEAPPLPGPYSATAGGQAAKQPPPNSLSIRELKLSQHFLKLIQTGATAEIAAAVEADPALIEARDPQGVSALLWSVYAGQPMVRDYLLAQLATRGILLEVFEAAAVGDVLRLEDILAADPAAAHALGRWLDAAASGRGVRHAGGRGYAAAARRAGRCRSQNPAQTSRCTRPSRWDEIPKPFACCSPMAPIPMPCRPEDSRHCSRRPPPTAATWPRCSSAGADAQHRTDLDKTAAEFARERGHGELADWLEASRPRQRAAWACPA